jgi:HPt (histidine-containing phosphotransfer) domain-containing protein
MPIDWTLALTHVDSDRRLLAELAEMFLDDCPRLLLQTREAIQKENYEELERFAHTMKGRLAFFGIGNICEKALSLETVGQACNFADALKMLEEIESDLQLIIPEFAALVREYEK